MADKELLKDLVHCSICFNIYEGPKILKCLHVYCQVCVDRLMENHKIQCPECRLVTEDSDIKNDFNKQRLVDACTSSKSNPNKKDKPSFTSVVNWTCESCELETQMVSYMCKECDKYICSTCEKVHKSFPAIKHHNINEVSDVCINMKQKLYETSELLDTEKENIKSLVFERSKITLEFKQVKAKAVETVNACCANLKKQVDDHHRNLIDNIKKIKLDGYDGSSIELESDLNKLDKVISRVYDLLTTSNIRSVIEGGTALNDEAMQIHSATSSITTKYVGCSIPKISILNTCLDAKTLTQLSIENTSFPQSKPTILEGANKLQVSGGAREKLNPAAIPAAVKTNNKTSKKRNKVISLASCTKEYIKVREEELSNKPHRISLVDNELWCTNEYGLNIFTEDCKLKQSVPTHPLCKVRSIIKAQNGNMIVACGNQGGLHEVDPKGKPLSKLSEGSFADVVSTADYLFALESIRCKVYAFRYKKKAWTLTTRFAVGQCSYFDTLALSQASLLVCSWTNSYIYKFSYDGTQLQKHNLKRKEGKYECKPRLCQCDSSSGFLVADFWNKKLSILNQSESRTHLNLKGKMDSPIDAVFDVEYNNLWVVTRSFDDYSLEKYSSV